MRKVYMDYSATTPVKEEVVKEMLPYFTEMYGNPSSLYTTGLIAKDGVDTARARVASLIGANPKEVFFTSCGTEADNWVLEGAAYKLQNKGNHIITTKIEHHAILHTCEYLAKHGFEVTYLDVDNEGFVSPEAFEAAITDKTIIASVMMVNNEIGTIQPIKELAAIAHKHNVLFHTDAVQGLGNVPIDVKDLDVDFMSMSGHKIYGPKGIGALYIKQGKRIDVFMHGGAQETKHRAGTENVAGIVGFGKAAQLAEENLDNHIKTCTELRNYFWELIQEKIPYVTLNGPQDLNAGVRHPGNLNVAFDYIEAESILIMLDMMFGISVSTGSACSSKSLEPSHVLTAAGVDIVKSNGTVRFTVGDFTTKEDIEYAADAMAQTAAKLRELSPVNAEKGW